MKTTRNLSVELEYFRVIYIQFLFYLRESTLLIFITRILRTLSRTVSSTTLFVCLFFVIDTTFITP